ncbi:MAG: polysaccharide deacetylase family protein [Terrimicrobiaceae bacterium]
MLRVLRWAALGALLCPRVRHPAAFVMASTYLLPTLGRNASWHGPVVNQFAAKGDEVWLTIDDGPLATCTPGLLEVLAEHGARASFFCVGQRVSAARELARRIIDEGHTIENHTYSHPAGFWWAMPPWLVDCEVRYGQHAIRTATGARPQFFRSPVGMNGPWLHGVAAREGLKVVGWSAAGNDGCPSAPSDIVGRILGSVKPGAIILLHEGDRPRHRRLALQRVLESLHERGLRCVIPEAEAVEP